MRVIRFVIVLGGLVLVGWGFLIAPCFAQDKELAIANRYFVQRKQFKKLLINPPIGAESLRRLRPQGFELEGQWLVQLKLKRLDSDASGVPESRDLVLKYTVLEWSGYPEAQLLLRIQEESPEVPDVYLEQSLYFSEGLSLIRRCRSGGKCGTWAPITAETLRLGGEDQGLGWEHGPVALDVGTMRLSKFNAPYAVWASEDFFGRKSAWKWKEGDPWPAEIETAQGKAVLISARGVR